MWPFFKIDCSNQRVPMPRVRPVEPDYRKSSIELLAKGGTKIVIENDVPLPESATEIKILRFLDPLGTLKAGESFSVSANDYSVVRDAIDRTKGWRWSKRFYLDSSRCYAL